MPDPIRVLYVDNDSNSLEVRADMLEEHGFDVATETSVAGAKRRLAATEIDCVLSDLDMPDQDGFDMLAHVRDIDPDLAFIVFTSHESEDVVNRILEAGATDYFAKSMTNVSYRLLAHRIRQAVRVTEADRAARRNDGGDDRTAVTVPRTDIDPDGRGSAGTEISLWGSATDVETEGRLTTAEQTDSPTPVEASPATADAGAPEEVDSSTDAEAGDDSGHTGSKHGATTKPQAQSDSGATRGEQSDSSAVSSPETEANEPPTVDVELGTDADTDPEANGHGRGIPETFDPGPGDGVLVECGSQDERKGHACLNLLGLDDVEGRNVLLIRYRRIGDDRLRRIAEDANGVHLISIGHRQSIPGEVEDAVETTHISNPSEMTRLGIVMTRAIGQWDSAPVDTVVCLDSLDILVGYTDQRSAFRFLHVLLSKLRSAGVIAHFHIDHSNSDPQSANTLKPLFESVVTIDDDGVRIE